MSSRPAASSTRGNRVAQSVGSSRSITTGMTASPCCSRRPASAAASRSIMTTRAPAASIAALLARPMPDAAPVTAATLPSSSLVMIFSLIRPDYSNSRDAAAARLDPSYCQRVASSSPPMKSPMETIEAYLARKHQELQLLNACLRRPHAVPAPRSVTEVIRHKFQLTAALKAEHALSDWTGTETALADAGDHRAGPFAFSYDYQRADLEVRGPSFYAEGERPQDAIYTISGMAAISALLLAMRPVLGTADLLMLPGSYGETQELVAAHARHLRPVTLTRDLADTLAQNSPVPRVLLIDSSTTASR